jgi:hypothetical protein
MSNELEVGDIVRVVKPFYHYEKQDAEVIWICFPYVSLRNTFSGYEYSVYSDEVEKV